MSCRCPPSERKAPALRGLSSVLCPAKSPGRRGRPKTGRLPRCLRPQSRQPFVIPSACPCCREQTCLLPSACPSRSLPGAGGRSTCPVPSAHLPLLFGGRPNVQRRFPALHLSLLPICRSGPRRLRSVPLSGMPEQASGKKRLSPPLWGDFPMSALHPESHSCPHAGVAAVFCEENNE